MTDDATGDPPNDVTGDVSGFAAPPEDGDGAEREQRSAAVRRLILGADEPFDGADWPEPDVTAGGAVDDPYAPGSADLLSELLAPPVHWPSLDAEEIGPRMRQLYGWVVELQHRFPEMVRLPACWHRHNGLVELLQALHDHERAAFAPTSPPTAAAGWHITFRDIEARLRDWIRAVPCGGSAAAEGRGAESHEVTTSEPSPLPQDVTTWIEQTSEVRR